MLQLVHFDFFVTKCVGNVDAFCIKKKYAKCVDMVHIDAFCNKDIDAFSIDLVYIEAKSNSKKTKPSASGPLLIMRLNYYSKAFGCVGCFQA